ncbi:MAG: CHAT domain-containing protein [Sulfuriflexus sp.]|nr:CHAT domain-containing protein [Sulfuriflexus sp.]
MRFKYLLSVLFGLCILPAWVYAQSSYEEAVAEFNNATGAFKIEYNKLLVYRGVRKAQQQNIDLDYVRKALKDYPQDTMLLFYKYAPDKSLAVWAVSEEIFAWEKIKANKQVLASVQNKLRKRILLDVLKNGRMPKRRGAAEPNLDDVKSVSVADLTQSLSQELLPSDISEALGYAKHLVIVPVESIGTIPFSMLSRQGSNKLLIEEMSMQVAPSMIDAVKPKSRGNASARQSEKLPLVVGNPLYANDPVWELPDLPGAKEEATTVAKLLGTTALTGELANEKSIRQKIENASLLYFATHGIADAESPLDNSFIAVAAEEGGDGRWTLREIMNSDLDAVDVVVLSACQTGLGKAMSGGTVNLARSFTLAGANKVVMSLWSIEDTATATLMDDFVKYYHQQGQSVPQALRSAMLELRKTHADPLFWAPFVTFGGRTAIK